MDAEPSSNSSATALADGRRLHEPVAREAARGVHALADPADDRVRVGRHVVQPGPRTRHRRTGGRRIAMREPVAPVLDERLVDLFAVGPAGRRLAHRETKRLAAAAEMEAGLGLEHHRQVGRQRCAPARLDELTAERPDREVGPTARASAPRPAITRMSRFELTGVDVLAHLDALRNRALDELARDRRRLRDTVLASTRPRRARPRCSAR